MILSVSARPQHLRGDYKVNLRDQKTPILTPDWDAVTSQSDRNEAGFWGLKNWINVDKMGVV